MIGRLANKVAIVTGSSNGIGRAIAVLLAQEGAKVVCSDILAESRGESIFTHEQIKKTGGNAIFVKTDVTKESQVSDLVETAVREYGRLDIMCNNAGIAVESQKHSSIWDCEEESFNTSFDVNAKGVFLGCKHASKVMKEQEPGPNGDRGWIVNTGSIMSLQALAGTISYTTSKHAVAGITRVAALDCAPHRIHVNAVCPGFIATDMTQAMQEDEATYTRLSAMHPFAGGGFGHAIDVARAVLFLCSPDNSFMTGVMMPVDGGYCVM